MRRPRSWGRDPAAERDVRELERLVARLETAAARFRNIGSLAKRCGETLANALWMGRIPAGWAMYELARSCLVVVLENPIEIVPLSESAVVLAVEERRGDEWVLKARLRANTVNRNPRPTLLKEAVAVLSEIGYAYEAKRENINIIFRVWRVREGDPDESVLRAWRW